jgi:hypothetical protein
VVIKHKAICCVEDQQPTNEKLMKTLAYLQGVDYARHCVALYAAHSAFFQLNWSDLQVTPYEGLNVVVCLVVV